MAAHGPGRLSGKGVSAWLQILYKGHFFHLSCGEKRDITESRGVQRNLRGAKSPSQLAAAESGNILCVLVVWWQGGRVLTLEVLDCFGWRLCWAPSSLSPPCVCYVIIKFMLLIIKLYLLAGLFLSLVLLKSRRDTDNPQMLPLAKPLTKTPVTVSQGYRNSLNIKFGFFCVNILGQAEAMRKGLLLTHTWSLSMCVDMKKVLLLWA